MFKMLLAAAVVAAGFAATAPASAKRFHLYKTKNSTQTVKSGGRAGAHHGQRFGKTSQ